MTIIGMSEKKAIVPAHANPMAKAIGNRKNIKIIKRIINGINIINYNSQLKTLNIFILKNLPAFN